MYKQSDAALAAWRATERTLDGKVTITDSSGNETNYGTSDITSIAYDSGAWTGDTFSIGSTYENNITVTFAHLVEGLKQGYKVTAKIGIKLPDGTYEYCPLGVFIISDEITMDRNNDATTIKAYDQFCVMQGTYTSKLTYPAKITDVIAEIANMSGVELNTDDTAELPTQTDLASAISGQTYCTAIGWIAQFYGGFALFDRDGKLTIRTVTDASYILDASQYEQSGLTKNEATYQIGGMSVSVTTTTTDSTGESSETTSTLVAGETSGSQIELTNNVMTQARLDSIWSAIKDITFYPYSLTWFGNPAIEAGDWLTLKDTAGNSFNVPNNSCTMTFDGGLTATSKADQTSTSSSSYSYSGTLSQTVKQLAGRQGATGNYIFGTDTVEEPTTAKIGDLWYKQNGNQVEMWQYVRQSDGTGKWKLIVSDATGEEIKDQVDKAMAEADTAKQNANTAVGNANSALEKAETAIDNAQTASDTANDATTVANNAISAANTANNNASSALSSATSAVSTANTASDNASSALTKAESAISTANSSSTIANAVKQDVTNLKDGSTMTIAEIESGLALKLVKKDLDGYATESWASTQISATASGLQTQITSVKSTATTNTTNINTLNSRADGFDVDIASVQTQVNDSAVGTNLFVGTKDFDNLSSWADYGGWTILTDTYKGLSIAQTDQDWSGLSQYIQVRTGETYTFSVYARYTSGTGTSMLYTILNTSSENGYTAANTTPNNTNVNLTSDWQRVSFTFTITSDGWVKPRLERTNKNTNTLQICGMKLELGSHATDWCLAPSEQATQNWTTNQISVTSDSLTAQITSVKKTADTNKTNITTLSANVDGISTNVASLQTDNNTNKTNISTLQQKATGFESNIATINTNVSSNTTNINSLQATSTSLSSTLSSVQTQVNNSAVGTNLLVGSKDFSGTWTNYDNWTNDGWADPNGNTALARSNMWCGLNQPYTVAKGQTYTFSAYYYLSSEVTSAGFYSNANNDPNAPSSIANVDITNNKAKWVYFTFTFTAQATGTFAGRFELSNTDGTIHVGSYKLEKGSVATDWSANPADNATVTSVSNITQKVDSLSTVVSGKVDNTTYTSKITELANSIATKVESSTYNSKMTQLDNAISAKVSSSDYTSQVNVLTNQINSRVSQTDWANSAVGANLLKGTKDFSGTWTNYSSWTNDGWADPNGNTALARSDTWNGVNQPYTVTAGQTYTFSAYYYLSSEVTSAGFYSNANNDPNAPSGVFSVDITNNKAQWQYFTFTFVAQTTGAFAGRFELGTAVGTIHVGSYKLEKGSYATPWCPAASEIANYSQIQQLSDNINLRVAKNDVINQINISTEGILIAGKKVHITGQTTIDNAVIKSAMIDSISADKITAGTLNAANVSVINLNANNISSGTLSGDYISGGTITGVSFHQSSSSMNTWIDNNGIHNTDGSRDIWIKSGLINFKQGDTDVGTVYAGSTSQGSSIMIKGDQSSITTDDYNTSIDVFKHSFGGVGILDIGDGKHSEITVNGYIDNLVFLTDTQTTVSEIKQAIDNSGDPYIDLKTSTASSNSFIDISPSAGVGITSTSNDITLEGNTVQVYGNFSVSGSKNAIVQTSAGWAKINAYETAEYYFGDIGETETGSGNSVKIVMDSLFLETVNTSVGYQVFITPYSDAKIWVDERNSDNFVVKSDTPNAKFAYEIKAKRKGYENTRLEIDEDFGKEAA